MLACTRIGAVHTVVFGGFSPRSTARRIIDSNAKVVITAVMKARGGRAVPLKKNVVTWSTDQPRKWKPSKKWWCLSVPWWGCMAWAPWYLVAWGDSECISRLPTRRDECGKTHYSSFIISGSTGKPKGVMHTTGGYLVYAAMTFKYVFDYQEGETFWCTRWM